MNIKTLSGIITIMAVLPMNARSQTTQPLPIILAPPQSQTVLARANVIFSVTATNCRVTPPLPLINSGTLQLWLKADAGVVTNGAGLVSQWQDQSGNSNDASQASTINQPLLVSPTGLGGEPAVRFNGIQDKTNGSYMSGTGLVDIPSAMTAFTVYNAFSTVNFENVPWDVGIPDQQGANRVALIASGDLYFSFRTYDFGDPFVIPTNTYRILTDRLDTNEDTLDMFDTTADGTTSFTNSVTGATTPGAGYFVGGTGTTLNGLGEALNFNGDIAEFICYKGYLSEADRLAVTSYLEQKYFQTNSAGTLNYQWQFNGANLPGATSSTLTLTNVVQTNLGTYAVVVSNAYGPITSSNATLSMYPYLAIPFGGLDTYWGYTNILEIDAWGTGPLSYQWCQNGIALASATNETLDLMGIQFTNAGLYSVVVTSPLGSVTNTPEQVVVNPAGVSFGGLYPSVLIQGVVGYDYIIQSTTNLADTNAWASVTNLTLTQPTQLWVDTNTDTTLPGNPKRFYQVLPGQ